MYNYLWKTKGPTLPGHPVTSTSLGEMPDVRRSRLWISSSREYSSCFHKQSKIKNVFLHNLPGEKFSVHVRRVSLCVSGLGGQSYRYKTCWYLNMFWKNLRKCQIWNPIYKYHTYFTSTWNWKCLLCLLCVSLSEVAALKNILNKYLYEWKCSTRVQFQPLQPTCRTLCITPKKSRRPQLQHDTAGKAQRVVKRERKNVALNGAVVQLQMSELQMPDRETPSKLCFWFSCQMTI